MKPPGKILAFCILGTAVFSPPSRAQSFETGSTSDSPLERLLPPPFSPPGEFRSALPSPRLAVFFPPAAPVYGTAVANAAPIRTFNGRSSEPPDDLGNYVGEFFYPALSTRLFAHKLDKKLARRLEAYMAERTRLVNDLHNTLLVLQTADPQNRERELRAFAAVQTPQILTHEKAAEELRIKLIEGRVLDAASADWSEDRPWKLGDAALTKTSFGGLAALQVIRAAAFYQEGLIPEQRGLLCEIVEQERRAALMPRSRLRAPEDSALVFLSPEMSRLRLPEIPDALNAKIAAYTRAKAELKEELRRAVVENDQANESRRNAVFRRLAESQWPRIEELEELAGDIRHDFAALPPLPPPPLPPRIPPDLVARIEACKAEQSALESERIARIQTVSRRPLLTTTDRSKPLTSPERSDRLAQRKIEVQEAGDEFLRENADRYAALENALKSLSADLLHFAMAHLDPVTGDPMDVKILLARVNASERFFDRVAREDVLYKNYRLAMLEPGLSPAQRRLLFNAARVELAQPLPPGERFPTGRFPLPTL